MHSNSLFTQREMWSLFQTHMEKVYFGKIFAYIISILEHIISLYYFEARIKTWKHFNSAVKQVQNEIINTLPGAEKRQFNHIIKCNELSEYQISLKKLMFLYNSVIKFYRFVCKCLCAGIISTKWVNALEGNVCDILADFINLQIR